MKKLIAVFSLIFISILPKAHSQDLTSQENNNYYWFEIKVKTVIHEDTKKPTLVTKRISKKINSGTFNRFAESYKKSLTNEKIAIGPYEQKETAKLAQECYKISKFSSNEPADKFITNFKSIENVNYFFFSKINFNDDGSIIFERMPARVANGSIKDFLLIVNVGLPLNLLAIGPFNNQLNAEKAKYISRKHGELNYSAKKNGQISADLEKMAQQWKGVKIELKKGEEKKETFIARIHFPAKYFKKDAVQYIKIVSMGKVQTTLGENTFQGEEFRDNNIFVSFDKGCIYEFKLKEVNRTSEENKIILKSTIFTDTEIFECEPIELK